MDHHVVSNVDAHMRNTVCVVGSFKENQISGSDIRSGDQCANIAQSLRSQTSNVPTTVVDDPGNKA